STDSDVQRGIDASSDGDTVNVEAGTYVVDSAQNPGGIIIDKQITLKGANAGIDGNSNSRGAETTFVPSVSNNDISTGTIVVYVAADNVTIDGLTVDGNNTGIGGAIDASDGIAEFDGQSNVTITNNIIQNTSYAAIDFDNTAGAATGGNAFSHNL